MRRFFSTFFLFAVICATSFKMFTPTAHAFGYTLCDVLNPEHPNPESTATARKYFTALTGVSYPGPAEDITIAGFHDNTACSWRHTSRGQVEFHITPIYPGYPVEKNIAPHIDHPGSKWSTFRATVQQQQITVQTTSLEWSQYIYHHLLTSTFPTR